MPVTISARATCIPRQMCGPPPKRQDAFGRAVRDPTCPGCPSEPGHDLRRRGRGATTDPFGIAMPTNSVSRVTHRENIGSVGCQRSVSSIAGRNSARSSRTRCSTSGRCNSVVRRDAHLLPGRAGPGLLATAARTNRSQRPRGDGECRPRRSISASTRTLIRSSCGCSRRAATIGARISRTSLRVAAASRTSRACSTGNAEAAGDGEHRDRGAEVDVQLRTAVPVPTKVSIRRGPSPRSNCGSTIGPLPARTTAAPAPR